jgi:flagellar biogenesis protein FliO
MPPLARIAGLMLILAGPACLAAQRPPPTGSSASSLSSSHPSTAGETWDQDRQSPLERQRRELARALGSVAQPRSHAVQPATYNVPAEDAVDEERLPHAQPQYGELEPLEKAEPPSRPGGKPPIPLGGHSRSGRQPKPGEVDRPGGPPSLITVGSSLAVVLGLFFVVAWLIRRAAPGGSAVLPKEVVEVLGRAVLTNRGQVQLVRCGAKLLLVSVTPTGVETLTEITDPEEVNRLVGLCREGQPNSATATFRQVFQHLAGQRPDSRFGVGSAEDAAPADARTPGTIHTALEGRDA